MSLFKELFHSTLDFDELPENVLEQMSVEVKDKIKNGSGKILVCEEKDGVLTPIELTDNQKIVPLKKMSLIDMLEETRSKERTSADLLAESMSLHMDFIRGPMSFLRSDNSSVHSLEISLSSTPAPVLSKKKKKKFTKKKPRGDRIVPRKQKNVSYKQSKRGHR